MIGEKFSNLWVIYFLGEKLERSNRKEVQDLFVCLLVVMNPAGWPYFLVRAVMGPASRPHFFVRAVVGLAIGGVVRLAIAGAVSTGADVAFGFSVLFLW